MEWRESSLATCDLGGTDWARDLPPGVVATPEDIASGYDRSTLWYEALWHRGRVRLICPRPYNLAPLLAQDRLQIDGRPVRGLRHRPQERHDFFDIPCRTRPSQISVKVDDTTALQTPVNTVEDAAFFKGKNTVFILSKNNDLHWITDFTRYHCKAHNLQAALFIDNGSDQYEVPEIADALARGGLEHAMLMRLPLRYGARTSKTVGGQRSHATEFLQMSLLNIARLRFLRSARAVLNCDIDEFVSTDNGQSIFDRAASSPLGLVRFGGLWRYCDPDLPDGQRPGFADHCWAPTPEEVCAAKYCVRPRSILGQFPWSVHKLNKLRQNTRYGTTRAKFWHFRRITTSWKSNIRETGAKTPLSHDPDMAQALKKNGLGA